MAGRVCRSADDQMNVPVLLEASHNYIRRSGAASVTTKQLSLMPHPESSNKKLSKHIVPQVSAFSATLKENAR